ncbi:MAG: hypothetical protein IJM23_02560 [Lachnospiraceae bacterium]|nr:hypothetical protein [Lachnospiraceae bacterium]
MRTIESAFELQKIKSGEIPKVLLIGNGINRCFGQSSWESSILKVSTGDIDDSKRELIKDLPYPLRIVIESGDCVDGAMKLFGNELIGSEICDEQRQLLLGFLDKDFDAVLTTNYSYELEKSLVEEFKCLPGRANKYRKNTIKGSETEEQFGIYKFFLLGTGADKKYIWHIHGEAARYSSMIMGHYYYGKLIALLQRYSSGLIRRYKGCLSHNTPFVPQNWIDYFLIGDVHIVGFGMDLSEFDIWWLVNMKKRNFKDCGKIFWYEPNLDKETNFAKRSMAESYGIEVITEKVKNNQYKKYFESLIDRL